MTNLTVVTKGDVGVVIRAGEGDAVLALAVSWPEANRLQSELRQACVDAGIAVRP